MGEVTTLAVLSGGQYSGTRVNCHALVVGHHLSITAKLLISPIRVYSVRTLEPWYTGNFSSTSQLLSPLRVNSVHLNLGVQATSLQRPGY